MRPAVNNQVCKQLEEPTRACLGDQGDLVAFEVQVPHQACSVSSTIASWPISSTDGQPRIRAKRVTSPIINARAAAEISNAFTGSSLHC